MAMGAPSAPSQMILGPPGSGVLQEGQGVAGIVALGGAMGVMQLSEDMVAQLGKLSSVHREAPPVRQPWRWTRGAQSCL